MHTFANPMKATLLIDSFTLPYTQLGTVAVSLAVLHKAVGVGTADMLKAVGTLRQGTEVTVTGRNGPFAQLKNGLWMKESFLEA